MYISRILTQLFQYNKNLCQLYVCDSHISRNDQTKGKCRFFTGCNVNLIIYEYNTTVFIT